MVIFRGGEQGEGMQSGKGRRRMGRRTGRKSMGRGRRWRQGREEENGESRWGGGGEGR